MPFPIVAALAIAGIGSLGLLAWREKKSAAPSKPEQAPEKTPAEATKQANDLAAKFGVDPSKQRPDAPPGKSGLDTAVDTTKAVVGTATTVAGVASGVVDAFSGASGEVSGSIGGGGGIS